MKANSRIFSGFCMILSVLSLCLFLSVPTGAGEESEFYSVNPPSAAYVQKSGPVADWPPLKILALPVQKSIKASQGFFEIGLRTWTDYEIGSGNGVLVVDDRHVLTMAHGVPDYPDLAGSKTTNYFFNGVPAKFIAISKKADLAIFELEHPIPGMQPADVADKFEFGKVYTGLAIYADYAIAIKKAEVVGVRDAMLKFDQPLQPGISGTPLWDDDGKLVSMISATSKGFSEGTRPEIIKEFLDKARNYIKQNAAASSDRQVIDAYGEIFKEILSAYAIVSLNKPADLALCAEEMLSMKADKDHSCRDRWSQWNSKEQQKEIDINLEGKYAGIGAGMENSGNKVIVNSVFEKNPAAKAGVKAGDEVLEVDGVKVKDVSDAVKRIRGPAGTPVKVVVNRGGQRLEFDIVRADVKIPSVKVSDLKPGLIVMTVQFSEDLVSEIQEAFTKLEKDGVKNVILDLRNNPGGHVDSAMSLLYGFAKPADTFIVMHKRTEDIIFDAAAAKETFKLPGQSGAFRDIHLVVLINENSASASELVSGALKDWGYPVVGVRSFGKGVGQKIIPLSDGSRLRLTEFEFLVGNSRTKINGVGVEPTYAVINKNTGYYPSSYDDKPPAVTDKTDYQLLKAIEIIEKAK